MKLTYDKIALQEYMDDIGGVGESLIRCKDECFFSYNNSKQYYTRLHTELEEANRKAYNMVEFAESLQRSADADYELAMRRIENAEDDSEREVAQEQLKLSQARQVEAAHEISVASTAYAKAQNNMKKLMDIWDKYQPSIESTAHKVEDCYTSFVTLVSNGNSDIGEYMSIMDKAQAALYDRETTTNLSNNTSNIDTSNKKVSESKHSPYSFKSKAGNMMGIVNTAGVASIVMSIAGKEQSFPYTKSGAAKAYRVTAKSGDSELSSQANLLFSSFDSSSTGILPNQQYVTDTLSNLEAGLPGTFDTEMIMAGSQERKLNSPSTGTSSGITRGKWSGTTFVLDDNYVLEKYNDEGLTIAEIKRNLLNSYGINVDGIPYVDGIADFSGISVATIPTADIVISSTGMTSDEYNSLSQRERTEIFQSVFSDAKDGKSKRERNFEFADQIAAERQIPIPGLPDGYTASELKKWRSKHKFSWDEQVTGGYNLVPTIIHGNVSHTGLVSTSGSANTYLEKRDEELRLHPENFCWDEEDAPISILELKKKH